jgi:hypothetical protein
MAVLSYRDHYISVLLTPDKSGTFSYIPIVEIRPKRDNNPAARLILTEAFATFTEARAQGLDAGKKWVDERNPKRKSVEAKDESEKKAQNRNSKVAFGFKS